MRVIIDRFEENFAVIELDGKILNVPRQLFPNAREGDTVEIAVLGRLPREGEEPPHEIFERLRRKSRKKRKITTPASAVEGNSSPEPSDAEPPEQPDPSKSELTNS